MNTRKLFINSLKFLLVVIFSILIYRVVTLYRAFGDKEQEWYDTRDKVIKDLKDVPIRKL